MDGYLEADVCLVEGTCGVASTRVAAVALGTRKSFAVTIACNGGLWNEQADVEKATVETGQCCTIQKT